jgi:hypothetical protein
MIRLSSGEILGGEQYPINTVEERRRTIVALATRRLVHHRTLTGAISCLQGSLRYLVMQSAFSEVRVADPQWDTLAPEVLSDRMGTGKMPRLQVVALWGQVCDIERTDMAGLHLGADLEALRDESRGGALYAARPIPESPKPLPHMPFPWDGNHVGYDRWMDDMSRNIDESWDCDSSMEDVVLRYVRSLEARCDMAGVSRSYYSDFKPDGTV